MKIGHLFRGHLLKPCNAEIILEVKIHLHFLLFLNTEIVQEIFQGPVYPMVADALVIQGARASAAMVLTVIPNIPVSSSAKQRLKTKIARSHASQNKALYSLM